VVDLFLDIGSLAAHAHIDARGARMSRFFLNAIQNPIGPPLHTMMVARLLGFFGSLKWTAVDVGGVRCDTAQAQNVAHAVVIFI